MRKFTKTVFCLVLAGLYLIATAGFPIHYCLQDGSHYVLLFARDFSCQAIHAQGDQCLSGCCPAHHDDDCCSTRVFLVDDPSMPEDESDAPGSVLAYKLLGMFSARMSENSFDVPCVQFARLLHPRPLEQLLFQESHMVPLRL